ncbi:hypothetical protein L2E82_35788 [Cichorium intybus]|uniref:Uncharacterized protein n=1 Tax=Cichorium intybus TaxID=13427 RepID=A0ACB9BPR0_CICIN|nr:hypothetical protein L2E82_35788 [Cichorium intybus]
MDGFGKDCTASTSIKPNSLFQECLMLQSLPVDHFTFLQMIFGSATPVESYCAHLLLSRDEIYFVVLHSKGSSSVYATKTLLLTENPKVEEMKRRIVAKEAADKEFNEFLELLKSAKAMPPPQEGSQIKKAAGGDTVLLRFSEMLKLFHEFAHVVHCMSNCASCAKFSGTQLDPEFVEIPALVLKNWNDGWVDTDSFTEYTNASDKKCVACIGKLKRIYMPLKKFNTNPCGKPSKRLENCSMLRPAYAVEYDYLPDHQCVRSFMTKKIEGLFFSGQINGTTGYEEAAACCSGYQGGKHIMKDNKRHLRIEIERTTIEAQQRISEDELNYSEALEVYYNYRIAAAAVTVEVLAKSTILKHKMSRIFLQPIYKKRYPRSNQSRA